MTEQEITRHVESLAATVVPGDPPIDVVLADAARVRRRRTAVTVVAVVAAVMVAVGLSASLGGGPRRALEPVDGGTSSPSELCRGFALQFGTSTDAGDRASSPERLAGRWLLDGSHVQEISAPAQDRRRIAVGREPGRPVVVLEAVRIEGGWTIEFAWGCLDPSSDPGCGARVDDADGTPFRLEPADPDGVGIGVGRIVGQGSVPACARFEIDGTSYAVRGAFAPITLYSANEMPVEEELTATIRGDDVRRLHPVP